MATQMPPPQQQQVQRRSASGRLMMMSATSQLSDSNARGLPFDKGGGVASSSSNSRSRGRHDEPPGSLGAVRPGIARASFVAAAAAAAAEVAAAEAATLARARAAASSAAPSPVKSPARTPAVYHSNSSSRSNIATATAAAPVTRARVSSPAAAAPPLTRGASPARQRVATVTSAPPAFHSASVVTTRPLGSSSSSISSSAISKTSPLHRATAAIDSVLAAAAPQLPPPRGGAGGLCRSSSMQGFSAPASPVQPVTAPVGGRAGVSSGGNAGVFLEQLKARMAATRARCDDATCAVGPAGCASPTHAPAIGAAAAAAAHALPRTRSLGGGLPRQSSAPLPPSSVSAAPAGHLQQHLLASDRAKGAARAASSGGGSALGYESARSTGSFASARSTLSAAGAAALRLSESSGGSGGASAGGSRRGSSAGAAAAPSSAVAPCGAPAGKTANDPLPLWLISRPDLESTQQQASSSFPHQACAASAAAGLLGSGRHSNSSNSSSERLAKDGSSTSGKTGNGKEVAVCVVTGPRPRAMPQQQQPLDEWAGSSSGGSASSSVAAVHRLCRSGGDADNDDDDDVSEMSASLSTDSGGGSIAGDAIAARPPAQLSAQLPRGLDNLGNTCFANAVLQALNCVPALVDALRAWARSPAASSAGGSGRGGGGGSGSGATALALAALFDDLRAAPARAAATTSPARLLAALARAAGDGGGDGDDDDEGTDAVDIRAAGEQQKWQQQQRQQKWQQRQQRQPDRWWGGGEQQDADEFLTALTAALQADTNRVRGRPAYRELPGTGTEADQAAAAAAYARSWHDSVAEDVFGGRLQSTVTCRGARGCGARASHCFDAFLALQLPLPARREPVTLEELFAAFVAPEELGDGERIACPVCGPCQPATKALRLWQCPPRALVVTLKRFESLGGGGGGGLLSGGGGSFGSFRASAARKVTTPVTLPRNGAAGAGGAALDLRPYCSARGLREAAAAGEPPPLYRLAAVVDHAGGGVGGGHYTTLGQLGGRWYEFDDARVRPQAREPSGDSRSAYVLVFTRVRP